MIFMRIAKSIVGRHSSTHQLSRPTRNTFTGPESIHDARQQIRLDPYISHHRRTCNFSTIGYVPEFSIEGGKTTDTTLRCDIGLETQDLGRYHCHFFV